MLLVLPSGDLLAQSVYQPAFLELRDSFGYTTGSVEFNRRLKLWRPESSEKDENVRRPAYSFRTSLPIDLPIDAYDEVFFPAWRDLESDEFCSGRPESGLDLLFGIHGLESDHQLEVRYSQAYRDHRRLSALQLGPQVGLQAMQNWKRLSADLRLAPMISYHRRKYEYRVSRPIIWFLPGDSHRTSDDVSFGSELRLSG